MKYFLCGISNMGDVSHEWMDTSNYIYGLHLQGRKWKIERHRARTGTRNGRNRNLLLVSTYRKSRGDLYDKRQDGVFRRIGWEIKDPEPWPNGDLSRRILSTIFSWEMRANTSRKSSLIHYPKQLESRYSR